MWEQTSKFCNKENLNQNKMRESKRVKLMKILYQQKVSLLWVIMMTKIRNFFRAFIYFSPSIINSHKLWRHQLVKAKFQISQSYFAVTKTMTWVENETSRYWSIVIWIELIFAEVEDNWWEWKLEFYHEKLSHALLPLLFTRTQIATAERKEKETEKGTQNTKRKIWIWIFILRCSAVIFRFSHSDVFVSLSFPFLFRRRQQPLSNNRR